jgi:hypothetical protein
LLEDRTLPSLFGPPTLFHVSYSQPGSVAVGDFNGDGIPDLAVVNGGSNSVSILLGDGHGGFGPPTNYPVGAFPLSVTVGDFNGDGIPDLAVANVQDDTVSVLLGKGDGTFGAATNHAVALAPTAVAVGDFGTGTSDLAVADSNGAISLLLGDGHGNFPETTTRPVGLGASSVAVGDFDGDGTPDLAVANQGDNTVSVLLGDGGLAGFLPTTSYKVGAEPTSVAVGDFGNGHLDLAVANIGDNTVSVLLGNGDGSFAPAVTYPVGSNPIAVAVGDFNGDGTPDLAVANLGDNTVSVLLGDGHGGFGAATNFRVGQTPVALAVGDFNGDGAPDLAVVAQGNGAVDGLLNQARVTTTALTSSANPAAAGQLVTLTAAVTQAVPGPFGPTGLVTFMDGATPLGTGTLDGTGHASFTTTALATGSRALTAAYQGDPHFNGNTSPVLNQLVNQVPTAVSLTASANPGVVGQPVIYTATVGPFLPSDDTPTGSILFLDNSTSLGTATLSGGVATLTTTFLAPGDHPVSAVYQGDGNFAGSTAGPLHEAINAPAPVITALNPTSVPEGSPALTLTITGSSFLPGIGLAVTWNGTPLTVTAASGTQIQAAVPAALLTDESRASVVVTNSAGLSSLPQTFTVADAPLVALGKNLNVTGNKGFSGVVATFTDGNLSATAADFQAIIVWDNGVAQFGMVSGGGGSFTISGSHTFGNFNTLHVVSVRIFDKGGSRAFATDYIIDPPGGADPAGGDVGAAALPGDNPPVAPRKHHRPRHHHGRPPKIHARRHHREGVLAE